jgi:hypothetical protein
MARVAAILKALAVALRRDQRSAFTFAGNNFFIVTVLLLQNAGGFIYLLIGFVLLFPLSTDPLRKVPSSRLSLWPLAARERRLLRLLSPWVNPLTWALAALAVWAMRGGVTAGLWATIAGVIVVAFVLSDVPHPNHAVWRIAPPFPGPLGELVRKNVREMLSTLDFYCALLLSLATLAWRLFGQPLPREALMAVSVLEILAFSSYAQCLFGLDGPGGRTRYRLLPIPAWQILLAKDLAWLAIAIALALPLAPIAALGGAFVALAFGNYESVRHSRTQVRWRFSSGGPVLFGLMQAAITAMAVSSVFYLGPLWLVPCALAWAVTFFARFEPH